MHLRSVVSMFDGISVGRMALDKAGITYDRYYACEIKPAAVELVKERYPDTIQLGDARDWKTWDIDWSQVDLILGGSPCQGVSLLNQKTNGLDHPLSSLLYVFVDVLRHASRHNRDMKFLLENTVGARVVTDAITALLGVDKVLIDSARVSAQTRKRYYWANWKFYSPPDMNITTNEVFRFDGPLVSDGRIRWLKSPSGIKSVQRHYTKINPFPKAGCLTASGHKTWNENYQEHRGVYRHLSVGEMCELQTIPAAYMDNVPYQVAFDLLGDSWTLDVITHILAHLTIKDHVACTPVDYRLKSSKV